MALNWQKMVYERDEARDWARQMRAERNQLMGEVDTLKLELSFQKSLAEIASVRADDAGREGYEQGQREIEERRCETCVYEGEVVCLEIGGPYRKLTGLCGTCRAAGFRAYRNKR